MSKKLIVTVILLNENKQILMEKNNYYGNENCWQFPGGKVEPGELLKSAAVRELKEELNITVNEDDLLTLTFDNYLKYNNSYIIFYYVCKKWKGVVKNNEGQTIEWFNLSNISKNKIITHNHGMISFLNNFLKSNYKNT